MAEITTEALRERLADLGFETYENEEELLEKSIKRAETTIINNVNSENVPDGLYFAALDIAAGEYLTTKLSYDDSNPISSITEGDISVSLGDGSETENLIDKLLCSGREEMASFRRLKW